MVTYEIRLDPESSTYDPMVLYQGDTDAHTMEIAIYEENDQPKDLDGYLVSVTVNLSDGHVREKLLHKEGESPNTVLWPLIKEDLAVPGKAVATIHVYGADDSKQTYPEFEYIVEADPSPDHIKQASTDYDLYINARHCGSYSDTTRYFMNNIVEYAGASYMALRDTQGQFPPSPPELSNAYWHLLSQRGSVGWKGSYDSDTPYGVGDMVAYEGSSWICVQECVGQAPPSTSVDTSECWDLLASIGAVSSVNTLVPDEEGQIHLRHADLLDIPIADSNARGHVKVGDGLRIDVEGTVSLIKSNLKWITGW